MAKLHSYYVLCPLIDQNIFLGVSEDKEEGSVIVSLGRNIVNKYRLSDQKQLGGWTSKHHITAPIIYDFSEAKYVGVFNHKVIKLWKEDVCDLAKQNKYKFSVEILKILPRLDATSLVIFKNGYCASLTYCIDQKDCCRLEIILNNEQIVDVNYFSQEGTDMICYIVQNSNSEFYILTGELIADISVIRSSKKLKRFPVKREKEDLKIVGKLIVGSNSPTVYVVWNDSKIFLFDLNTYQWKCIGTLPWISTSKAVSMFLIGEGHLALYGTGKDEDGAVIIIYNVVLGIGCCRYPLKIYSDNAKLYCMFNRIILGSGQSLVILPYALETSRNLSSLLATHDISNDHKMELADWAVGDAPVYEGNIEEELIIKGVTERRICSEYFPSLLQNQKHSYILNIIKHFDDIPEEMIVSFLKFGIKLFNYKPSCLGSKEEFNKLCEENCGPQCFLNYILSLNFSDSNIIKYLRATLELDDVLFLLTYISFLIEDDDCTFEIEYEKILLDWCTILLDSFYQRYLLLNTEYTVVTLKRIQEVIVMLMTRTEEIDKVSRLIQSLHSRDNNKDHENESFSAYAIEEVVLY